ncbi:MAG TPA: hypothetical protein VHX59_12165 [Mycobacteriales bacterium]|nr:hypothetical protein [Mycobacteriales bacterium]
MLLPILRGETQARLLAALLLHPGREASISELAGEVGTNPGILHGEVEPSGRSNAWHPTVVRW